MNDMPSTRWTVRFTSPSARDDIKFLTVTSSGVSEAAKRSHNYNQYALILETGLRTGEMIGLTWDAIDFEKRTLTVNKTLEFRHKQTVLACRSSENAAELSHHPADRSGL